MKNPTPEIIQQHIETIYNNCQFKFLVDFGYKSAIHFGCHSILASETGYLSTFFFPQQLQDFETPHQVCEALAKEFYDKNFYLLENKKIVNQLSLF